VTVTVDRKPGYDEIPHKVQVTVTVTVALNPGTVKYHKKSRSLTVTVRSSEPGYDEIPQKGSGHCDGNGSCEPGYDEILQKVQVTVTLTVALNPGMLKYHKTFRSL
jgi:hypothetical protein